MKHDRAPVPVSIAQWPEARAFKRVYDGNPEYQARLVMVLLGFRQDLLEWAHDEEAAKAIETVIRAFHQRHPEFMQDGFVPDSEIGAGPYHVEERLRTYMEELGIVSGESATE